MRLTKAKMDRWERDLRKAHALTAKVLGEQKAHLHASKGGRYSDLLHAVNRTANAVDMCDGAIVGVAGLANGEERRAPRVGVSA